MEIKDTYDSTSDPFQGDRVLRLQSIPESARIRRATAIITPRSAPNAAERFIETIDFSASPPLTWGATLSTGQTQQSNWAEVDFHARRTLARVQGDNLQGRSLQVDFGGVYVEINPVGGIKTPSDTTSFQIGASPATLPGLTVSKFKLTSQVVPLSTPNVRQVIVRSVPTNLSLRFGQMPAFWVRVGEMTEPETTPDFSLALQAFLESATPENGFYNVPLIVHSDSITRLQIAFNIEVVVEEDALGSLNSVVLPFDFSREPGATTDVLKLTLPMNSKLSPAASRARLNGSFIETRIAYDPMEKVTAQAGSPVGSVKSVAPGGQVSIAPNSAQAQPVSFKEELSATAIDLLLEVKETVRLRLDLREDLDGKPGPTSLLPKAVDFVVAGPVGLENPANSTTRPKWTSVSLPAEFRFKASDPQTPRRYWIVVESVEGEAQWSVAKAANAPNLLEALGLQHSTEDGLAWRESAAPKVDGALTAFFRLRRRPDRFEMPIALQIGAGEQAVRVSLDRFAPSGSVNLALDFDDFNKGLSEHLKKRAPACTAAEHLLNEDFQQWVGIRETASLTNSVSLSNAATDQAAEWNLTAGSIKRFYAQQLVRSFALLGLRVLPPVTINPPTPRYEVVQSAISQVTPVVASCQYDFSFAAIATDEDAFAEIIWRSETCGAATPDPVRVPIKQTTVNTGDFSTFDLQNPIGFISQHVDKLEFHRVQVAAPPAAEQAEVRFSVPDGVLVILGNTSLKGTAETIVNGDFRLTEGNKLVAWESSVAVPPNGTITPQVGLLKMDNTQSNTDAFEIKQTVAVKPGEPFTLTVKKGETNPKTAQGALPRVEVRWLKTDGSKIEPPVVITLDPASFNALSAKGTSPQEAANAEIHLIIPPRTSQEIESISLSFPARTVVPISFVAQAPGELTISDWQVGFEAEPGTRPPVPAKGLCAPTPPGSQPGEASHNECYCKCCGSPQPMTNVAMMETATNRVALVGACATCGDEMISFGGQAAADTPIRTTNVPAAPQPVFITATPVEAKVQPSAQALAPVEPEPETIAVAEPQAIAQPTTAEPAADQTADQAASAESPVTLVKGIGERRAEQLAEHGITSVETLATASPEQVAKVKSISETQAAKLIEEAKNLTDSTQ